MGASPRVSQGASALAPGLKGHEEVQRESRGLEGALGGTRGLKGLSVCIYMGVGCVNGAGGNGFGETPLLFAWLGQWFARG